jgi:hypothetical protein
MVILAVIVLAISLITSILLNAYLVHSSLKREKDLMDRLMAKDFGEYQSIVATQEKRRPRRFHMNDEREAFLEGQRLKDLELIKKAAGA